MQSITSHNVPRLKSKIESAPAFVLVLLALVTPLRAAAQAPAPGPGTVIDHDDGDAVISLGAQAGLKDGSHVHFFRDRQESLGGEMAVTRETLAVGRVVALSPGRAKVRLGVDERVPLGTYARKSERPLTASKSGPPRMNSLWELEITLRPFMVTDHLGGGLIGSVALGRRFEAPFHVQLMLDSVSIASAENAPTSSGGAALLNMSYDSQYFAIGLGAGAQTVNATDLALNPGSGLSIAQLLRLGARDGLHLMLRSAVVLFHSEFEFRGLWASLQIPVDRGCWLMFNGGGGDVGAAYGEAGLRVLVSGNGDVGSWFLSGAAGYAATFEETSCESQDFVVNCDSGADYEGAMMALGTEVRF